MSQSSQKAAAALEEENAVVLSCTILTVMVTLTLEYIYIVFGSFSIPIYCLMNRLIRILFLPFCANEISKYVAEKIIIKKLSFHRTWNLCFAMGFAGHWCGCVFYYIATKKKLFLEMNSVLIIYFHLIVKIDGIKILVKIIFEKICL